MLNAKLTVVGGDAKASEIQLRLPTIIGRGREASLTLPHPLVSRLHTEIVERDGRLVVRDLGSLNGTFVNNKRIEGEQILEPNQLLTLGNVTFRAIYDVDDIALVTEKTSHAATVVVTGEVGKVRPTADTASAPDTSKIITTAVASNDDPISGSAVAEESHVLVDASGPGGQHSIAMSQLDALGGMVGSAIDLAAPLDLDDAHNDPASAIDPAQFEFNGVEQQASVDPDQSGLGSFLKKLPR